MTQSVQKAIVVGTGFGCRIQIPALRGAGFEVAGLVGTDPARTAERAAANGVPRAFTSLDAAIAEVGEALVAISTPPSTHAALALRALEGGCHVLCEKPFAMDAGEARAMLAAAEKAGRVHALGNEFRFLPQNAAVARALGQGVIGQPRFASFIQISGFLSSFNSNFSDWWFDPSQGGGWFGTSGSHLIDQTRSWLGEFESVSASFSNVATTRGPVEDAFTIRFQLRNGIAGILQQCCAAPGPMAAMTQIAGTGGRLWLDGADIRVATAQGERVLPIPKDLELPPPPPLTPDPRHQQMDWQIMAQIEIAPYTELCRSVHAAITGEVYSGSVTAANFADGVANMAVMDAVRASAREDGRVMYID